jgi:hypothetical protein
MPRFADTYINTQTSQTYPFECDYELTHDVVHWKATVEMPDGRREIAEGKTAMDGESPPQLIAGNAVRQAVALESFVTR